VILQEIKMEKSICKHLGFIVVILFFLYTQRDELLGTQNIKTFNIHWSIILGMLIGPIIGFLKAERLH